MNSAFGACWLASPEVIIQVLFTSKQPKRNKMAFQIKLIFGRLFIQLVWYILDNYSPQCRWIVVDVYRAAKRHHYLPPLRWIIVNSLCFSTQAIIGKLWKQMWNLSLIARGIMRLHRETWRAVNHGTTLFPESTPLSIWRLREDPGTHRYDTHVDWSEGIDILTLIVIGRNCLPCKMTDLCSCICYFLCNRNEIIAG